MAECFPIETAPTDGEESILVSISGRAWFQACWDEDDKVWVTFNRYLESDERLPSRTFDWRWWAPLPAPPTTGERDDA